MAAANAGGASLGGFIIPIAFLVIFYVFAIRPQKKREKQIREMRDSLRVGDVFCLIFIARVLFSAIIFISL
ncbi:preprotein translocase subunit YajC [Schnuerera sp.]|uniref:preprotein translocase subunit YajC n=1 Tax=Schnuerera sp. TaxID=2794844 RepID=UPI002BFA24C5|nr:preprotein translocase subunit YajC [Schnuerera sp.]HSH36422.1 preprotein translocase subunit YajC [Schnuerera sp.]